MFCFKLEILMPWHKIGRFNLKMQHFIQQTTRRPRHFGETAGDVGDWDPLGSLGSSKGVSDLSFFSKVHMYYNETTHPKQANLKKPKYSGSSFTSFFAEVAIGVGTSGSTIGEAAAGLQMLHTSKMIVKRLLGKICLELSLGRSFFSSTGASGGAFTGGGLYKC